MKVFLEELQQAYEAYREDTDPNLPALPIRYGDFATWQRAHYSGPLLDKCVTYWRDREDGIDVTVPLCAVKSRPQNAPPHRIESMDFVIDANLTLEMGAAGSAAACTKRVVLLSALMAILQSESDGDSVCTSVLDSSRGAEELQRIHGKFANHHLIQVRREVRASVREYIALVKEAVLVASEEQAFAYYHYLDVEGRRRRFPVFFNYVPTLQGKLTLGDAAIVPYPRQTDLYLNFEMQIGVMEVADRIICRIAFADDLDHDAVRGFGERLLAALRAMLADLDAPLKDVIAAIANNVPSKHAIPS